MISAKPMPLPLTSLLAQLRHPNNCVGNLGEQAAGAIESLWRDNVRLSYGLLETEVKTAELAVLIHEVIEQSAQISKFGAIRSAKS